MSPMAAYSKPVAPFFEPGAPPPPLPLLTAHTDLLYDAPPLPTITAHEELPSFRRLKTPPRNPSPHTTPYARSARVSFRSPTPSQGDQVAKPVLTCKEKVPTSSRASTPTPTRNHGSRALSQSPNGAESSDLEGSMSELSSDADCGSDDDKISKPEGEPGRPGRGGYNLEAAMNWRPKSFKKLKVCYPSSLPFLRTSNSLG